MIAIRPVLTWPRAVIALFALFLLALPLSFERLTQRPQVIDVRFLDTVEFSLLHSAYPAADQMNALVLAAGCGMAAMAALLAWRGLLAAGLCSFFVITATLLGALAVEEAFELMEALAMATGFAYNTDLLIPIAGLAFGLRYRRLLVRSRRALAVGAGGVAAFGLAVTLDRLTLPRAEDPVESVASLLLLTAFVVLTFDLLTETHAAEATA